MQNAAPSFPGPKDRGWRIGLSCLGVLSLILAGIAAPFILGWLALGRSEGVPFPAAVLLFYIPAIASIALGAWTWRTKRVWWVGALVAVLGGAIGLSFGVFFAFLGLMVKLTA